MTAFVMCLPLLVMVFMASNDLWTLVAAQTRTQSVADAGVRYAVARANAGAALQGTDRHARDAAASVPAREVRAAALANGFTQNARGAVVGVDVEVRSVSDGRATYLVRTYQDGSDAPVLRSRTTELRSIEVKASQIVRITSWPLRELLGDSVVVSRASRGQVPREVVV